MDFAVRVDQREKIKENKKRDKYLDLARGLRAAMKHKNDGDINCNCCTRNDPLKFYKGAQKVKNRRMTSRDHRNYSIAKLDQNIEKSPGNLLSFRLQF